MMVLDMDGWIKTYRKMLDNPIVCKDADYFSVWIYLLLSATHKETTAWFGTKKITLKPGQLITGRRVISVKFHVEESKVQRILKCYENEHLITQQTSNKNRLISIVKWEEHQAHEQQNEQQIEQTLNNHCTTTEQPVNTYKNEKNIKNERNNIKAAASFDFSTYTKNSDLLAALHEFMNCRKKLKAPCTEYSIKKLLTELDKLASTDNEKIEIVNNSIVNGWKGVFPLKTITAIPPKKNAEKKQYIKSGESYSYKDLFDVYE